MRYNYVPTTDQEKLSFKQKLPNQNIAIIRSSTGALKGLYQGSYVLPDVVISKDTPPEKIKPLVEIGTADHRLGEAINRLIALKYNYYDTALRAKSLVAQAIFLFEDGQWFRLKTTKIASWNDWHGHKDWPIIEKNTLKIEDIRGVTYESILHVSAAILKTGPKVPSHIYRLHVPEYVSTAGEIRDPKPIYWEAL